MLDNDDVETINAGIGAEVDLQTARHELSKNIQFAGNYGKLAEMQLNAERTSTMDDNTDISDGAIQMYKKYALEGIEGRKRLAAERMAYFKRQKEDDEYYKTKEERERDKNEDDDDYNTNWRL